MIIRTYCWSNSCSINIGIRLGWEISVGWLLWWCWWLFVVVLSSNHSHQEEDGKCLRKKCMLKLLHLKITRIRPLQFMPLHIFGFRRIAATNIRITILEIHQELHNSSSEACTKFPIWQSQNVWNSFTRNQIFNYLWNHFLLWSISMWRKEYVENWSDTDPSW